MHKRKARMAELADAFVALPGGAGTLEELFEVWTWGQLGLHSKPAALVDPDGFYRPLRAQLDAMAEAWYLSVNHHRSLGVVDGVSSLVRWIAGYRHPPSKWDQSGSVEARKAHLPDGITSVGWIRFDENGHLLAVRTRGRNRFFLPGGKLEEGENLLGALAREVGEELGISLHRVRPAFTIEAAAHGRIGTRLTMHCFYADGTGEPRPGREIDEIAWLSHPDDPRAAPAVQSVLRRLASQRAVTDE